MFFCYIASLPNLWEFDLELVIHVNIANFLLFCVFLSVSCRFSFNFIFQIQELLLQSVVFTSDVCKWEPPLSPSMGSLFLKGHCRMVY